MVSVGAEAADFTELALSQRSHVDGTPLAQSGADTAEVAWHVGRFGIAALFGICLGIAASRLYGTAEAVRRFVNSYLHITLLCISNAKCTKSTCCTCMLEAVL